MSARGRGPGTLSPTLLVSGLTQLVGAASFLYAGFAVRHEARRTSAPSAASAFAVWWGGLGAYLLMEGTMTALAGVGWAPFAPWFVVRVIGPFFLGAALWGLTYYVAYVWTGRAALRAPLAALFALLSAALIAVQLAHRPYAVTPMRWLVELSHATPVAGPLYTAILAGFALPPILSSVGYLSLWSKTTRRDQRYRITLVGTSIILYLGSGLMVRLGTNDFLMFVNLAVFGLGMAVAVLIAYRPPFRVRVWLGLEAPGSLSAKQLRKREQAAALARRCSDLV